MTEYDEERFCEIDDEDETEEAECACAMEEVGKAQEVQARDRQQQQRDVESSGRHLSDKIVVNGGFDNGGNVDAGIRAVVNNYVRQGIDLQAMVDAANRTFESNRQQYYLGVGENHQLVLYCQGGPRTLSLR